MTDFSRSLAPKMVAMAASALAMSWASDTMAAEWEINIGGYMEAFAGFASVDGPTPTEDLEDFHGGTNTEIFFQPSITLDNGIKLGANIELEGRASTNTSVETEFDNVALTMNGSFGRILIGRTDTSYERFIQSPTEGVYSLNSPSLSNFLPFSGTVSGVSTGDDVRRGTLGSTAPSLSGRDNAVRIQYFTPRFAGFQIGASYAHNDTGTEPNREDFFDIAANYQNSFGGFDLDATAFYASANGSGGNTASPDAYGFGANLGFGEFLIGGSWAETNGSQDTRTDGDAVQAFVSYDTSPWRVSLAYFRGENADNEHTPFGPQERLETITVSGSYELKKGVRVNVFASYVDFDEDVSDPGFGTPGNDFDGFVIGTGIGLSF